MLRAMVGIPTFGAEKTTGDAVRRRRSLDARRVVRDLA